MPWWPRTSSIFRTACRRSQLRRGSLHVQRDLDLAGQRAVVGLPLHGVAGLVVRDGPLARLHDARGAGPPQTQDLALGGEVEEPDARRVLHELQRFFARRTAVGREAFRHVLVEDEEEEL